MYGDNAMLLRRNVWNNTLLHDRLNNYTANHPKIQVSVYVYILDEKNRILKKKWFKKLSWRKIRFMKKKFEFPSLSYPQGTREFCFFCLSDCPIKKSKLLNLHGSNFLRDLTSSHLKFFDLLNCVWYSLVIYMLPIADQTAEPNRLNLFWENPWVPRGNIGLKTEFLIKMRNFFQVF